MLSMNTYLPPSARTTAESRIATNKVLAKSARVEQSSVKLLKVKTTIAPVAVSNSISTISSNSRKDAARQKIAWLKMQLEGLMKFAGVAGKPSAAIRLAKELAAAVREYGSSDALPAMPQAMLKPSPTSALTGEAASDAAGEAKNAENEVSNNTQALPEITKDAAQIASILALASQLSLAEQGSPDKEDGSVLSSHPLANLPQLSGSGLSAEDRAFLVEAKTLMGKIKLLIAIESKKTRDDKKAQEAIQAMDDALKSTTVALLQENTGLAYASTGLSVSASDSTASFSATA